MSLVSWDLRRTLLAFLSFFLFFSEVLGLPSSNPRTMWGSCSWFFTLKGSGPPIQKRSRQTSRPLLASFLVRPRTLSKGVAKVLEEFDVYFKKPPIVNEKGQFDLDLSPCDYWKVNQHRFPVLAPITRDIMGIPVSSANIERAFSTAVDILSAMRNKIKPKLFYVSKIFSKLNSFNLTLISLVFAPLASVLLNPLFDLQHPLAVTDSPVFCFIAKSLSPPCLNLSHESFLDVQHVKSGSSVWFSTFNTSNVEALSPSLSSSLNLECSAQRTT
jgi:hypothetical protein